ncbi:MAG: AraC family transcriptional regulator [Chitinophagaceae bacterium]|nr:AraC family transcriptional regulator [Chitinophagaceae bacterium]
MTDTFQTFRPQHPLVARYVDYYYLEIKPANISNEFICFPHFNTSLSLYKSHVRTANAEMVYTPGAPPLQLFTPMREKVLLVKQLGPLHRVVIVFHPLGIQQFYRGIAFTDFIKDVDFFSPPELQLLLNTTDETELVNNLDRFLFNRFDTFSIDLLDNCIRYIFKHAENFSVGHFSEHMQVSRRHLNRLFQTHLGVSVKRFYEIVLFRKTIQQKLFVTPQENFTRLAYEFNFNDQSHLNKIYKKFTAHTPAQFFKRGTLLGHTDTFWHLLK